MIPHTQKHYKQKKKFVKITQSVTEISENLLLEPAKGLNLSLNGLIIGLSVLLNRFPTLEKKHTTKKVCQNHPIRYRVEILENVLLEDPPKA